MVDDEPANRELATRMLRRAGFDVVTAGDGRAALARLAEGAIDLVLLDVVMPTMDGLEALRAIRRSHEPTALPVIMMTALAGTDDVVGALRLGANDYVTKPVDAPVAVARIDSHLALRDAAREVASLAQQLEVRNAFLRQTFARYLSDDVVANLLQREEGLEIRGDRRPITVMVSDLRGFSTLTETLPPEATVAVLNAYLGTMSDVIGRYGGTVNEFVGDAVLAIFGAFETRDDDAERAVACAVAMQQAIGDVNARNRARGLPEVQMGIGIATGDATVGNIGSERRSKFATVGSVVNLAFRIEGHTLGGEVLVSPATFEAVRHCVAVDGGRSVWPKALDVPVTVRRVTAVHGAHGLRLPGNQAGFSELPVPVPVRLAARGDEQQLSDIHDAEVVALAPTGARLRCAVSMAELSEIRIEVVGSAGGRGVCHAKVVEAARPGDVVMTVRFSSRSADLDRHLERLAPAGGVLP